ncbi:hypothetical protein XSR1_550015 [Xenorhabdus szentirmaii DSM 16338]|uniref:Uncharacterized protein n=1 Tax=Xenorhabdus szentirmaii DSM 16338 TaxID=1427518 RepID=W1J2B1_9GAMM|nr:hypothetical protein XSR1_550015 [Xenorhabdus szentirmaii DSM 16338]
MGFLLHRLYIAFYIFIRVAKSRGEFNHEEMAGYPA